MGKKKKVIKRTRITKFSKLIYTLFFLLVLVSPIIIVGCKSFISKLNIDVEKLKQEVETSEKTNQSLTMKINELASLENIQEIAREYGLEYNNDNIKVVMK